VGGRAVTLPLKEFDLLEYLMRNSRRVLTRGQLIDRVWGSDYMGDTKTLDVHVKRLRTKIEPDPPPRCICSPSVDSATSSTPDPGSATGHHGVVEQDKPADPVSTCWMRVPPPVCASRG